MKSHKERTEFMCRRGKITTLLVAAFVVALSTGSTAQTAGPLPAATKAAPKGISGAPKAREPVIAEMSQAGEIIKVTDANGMPIPKRDKTTTYGQKRYLVGDGMATSPG